ncbi:hypothetical protein Tco_0829633 [Tanacetum coccineum]
MSNQQDIYDAGFENHPPMLNKDNYVPWSSRLLRYAKSKPNGKLLVISFKNDDELNKKEAKQMEADDQVIQTILIGLPEDIYADVDCCADNAKISRKRLKPGKHEHGNGRAHKELRECYQKSTMVNSSQPSVKHGQH